MPMLLYFLEPHTGRARAHRLRGMIRVGRDLGCGDISLDSPAVASLHAVIDATSEDRPTVSASSDDAALFVNGQLCRTAPLAKGDFLEFGDVFARVGVPLAAPSRPEPTRAAHARAPLADSVAHAPVKTSKPLSLLIVLAFGAIVVGSALFGFEFVHGTSISLPGAMDRTVVLAADGGPVFGSGCVVSPDGQIVTNAHVVRGSRNLVAQFRNGKQFQAEVVRTDETRDLALVKAGPVSRLPFMTFSPGTPMEVGQNVYAIGTPASGALSFSVTRGIISNTLRGISGRVFIQHDAALNPGNSGGPLVDSGGQPLGINTWKVSEAQGLGFAIPADEVANFLREGPERTHD